MAETGAFRGKQLKPAYRKGNAEVVQMFGGGTTNAGEFVLFDGNGNVVSGGFKGVAKGDILLFNGTTWVNLGVGADGKVFTANSAAANGADWEAIAESQVTGLVSDLASKVPNTRLINTTAPLTGGGALSSDLTLAVSIATGSTVGVVKPDGTTITVNGSGILSAAGTISSITLTVPSWLTVTGSPLTSSGTLAISATASEPANQFLATPSGSSGPVGLRAITLADLPAQPYDVICSYIGQPASGVKVLAVTFTRTVTFPSGFAGSQGTCGTNPNVTATYQINKISGGVTSSFGSVSVSTSGVFTFSGGGSFAAGDRMEVIAPSSGTLTFSDIAITFAGTR